jgi:hypothetical protein
VTRKRNHTKVLTGDVCLTGRPQDVMLRDSVIALDLVDSSVLSLASGSCGVDEAAEGALERVHLSLTNYSIERRFRSTRTTHLKTGCANPGRGG